MASTTADNRADVPSGPPKRENLAFDAIVLAGGRGTRLGGVDKPALVFAGQSLLQHAVDAASVAAASRICIVGPPRALNPSPMADAGWIEWVREDPPFGGPAAALEAGLEHLGSLATLPPPFVAVLAADLPRPGEALPLLLAELADMPAGADGVIAVDPGGRQQPLLAIYRVVPLRAALNRIQPLAGVAVSRALAPLNLHCVAIPGDLCTDIDRPADAERLGISLEAGV